MFLHMAGDDPFGEFGGVVLVFVPHDGVQDMQGHDGLVGGVFKAAGRAALRALARALGGDGGFVAGDVRVEAGQKGGVQPHGNERGAERGGIGLEGAGGVEDGLRAVVAGQVEFAVQPGGAQQHEGMGGIVDGEQVVVEQFVGDGLGFDAGLDLAAAGYLRGGECAGLRHGGGDEGELLSAGAGGREVGDVFGAVGGDGFTGGEEAGFVEVHGIYVLSVVFDCPKEAVV